MIVAFELEKGFSSWDNKKSTIYWKSDKLERRINSLVTIIL